MGNLLGCSCEEKGDTPLFEIKQKRGCTDILFLLGFIGLWAVVIIMLGMAADKGADPNRLIRGVDWNGNICGVDGPVKDSPFAAWPVIPTTQELYKIKVCVADCATTETSPVFRGPALQSLGYKSSKFLYYCLPKVTGNISGISGFDTASETATRSIGDLFVTYDLIGLSTLIAIVLAFFYLWFCKRMAGVLVWSTIVVVLLGGLLLGFAFLQQSTLATDSPNPERASTFMIIAYIVFGFTAIFLLIIIALRKRIKIAVEVVKEASKSVGDMPSMIFFPIIPFALTLLYFGFWIYGALEIFSVVNFTSIPMDTMGDDVKSIPNHPVNFRSKSWDPAMQNFFAVHFFHLLWNIQFLVYFSYMVIAGAVANWYFVPYQDNGKKARGTGDGQLPRSAVRRSVYRAVRYHLGTIAFGSLIIAIVQFIRAVVKYIEKTSKGKDNRIRRAIFCAIQCVLKCVQCCLDKLSKNAFVYSAIYGDAFCPSAWTSFAILWRNLARVMAINMVGSYISVLGKLLVAFGTTGLCIQILNLSDRWKSNLNSPILPAVIILLLSYMIAAIFMVVYETAVDTIFLCFLLDEEQNRNGVMLASKGLIDIVNRYQKKKELGTTGNGADPGAKPKP